MGSRSLAQAAVRRSARNPPPARPACGSPGRRRDRAAPAATLRTRVALAFAGRLQPRGWARRYAARNCFRSSWEKWQISKIVRRAAPESGSGRRDWRSARRSCGSCPAPPPGAGACPTGGLSSTCCEKALVGRDGERSAGDRPRCRRSSASPDQRGDRRLDALRAPPAPPTALRSPQSSRRGMRGADRRQVAAQADLASGARPCSTTSPDQPEHAGVRRSPSSASSGSSRLAAAMRIGSGRCCRSRRSPRRKRRASAPPPAPRPSCRAAGAAPCDAARGQLPRQHVEHRRATRRSPSGSVTIGSMTFSIAVSRRARPARAAGCGTVGPAQREPDAAHAEEGIAFARAA